MRMLLNIGEQLVPERFRIRARGRESALHPALGGGELAVRRPTAQVGEGLVSCNQPIVAGVNSGEALRRRGSNVLFTVIVGRE